MPKPVDRITKRWIRNKSDQYAAANGCRFDESRGKFTCDWIERHCKLYKNVAPDTEYVILDWHRDLWMRLFSWVKYSEFWKEEIRRFNRGGIWTPKKNAKSVWLTFTELYMTVGDGVHGQNCYVAAKDGTQARETQKNLLEAIRASSLLTPFFEINKTKGTAVHTESRSSAAIIAGDNDEAQEGLDGSCFIDEAHVCDEKLMKRLRYMGRARKEPLFLCVSTAGNNPSSWGKGQFDYGRAVNKAKDVKDIGYFHAEWSMPDDVKVSEIEPRIMSLGKLCNPAWNVLVDPEKFKQDYQESKRSKSAHADFLMYSLNLWQKSSNPWLPAQAWEECEVTLDEIDKALSNDSTDIHAGLDLSGVSDMVAFVECGNVEGKYHFDITLWLPEAYAENNATEQFSTWGKDKTIILCPGEVIDFQMVSNYILDRKGKRRIASITYDPMMARTFAQELQRGIVGKGREVLKEGLGCRLVEFPQTAPTWAKPSEDFERALIARNIRHPNNACLNWQAGHVEAKTDNYGNKRPIKPDNATKKIDGIVAMVMAFATASVKTQRPSISFI